MSASADHRRRTYPLSRRRISSPASSVTRATSNISSAGIGDAAPLHRCAVPINFGQEGRRTCRPSYRSLELRHIVHGDQGGTIRKVLAALNAEGVLTGGGRRRFIRSAGGAIKRFPEAETVPMAVQVERRFMEWMLRDNARPGTAINELDLARQFGVATTGIREFLNRFQRFGLIEKRPNAGWMLKGFTPGFALELFEIREMFELRSARAFAALPESSPFWEQMENLRREHLTLLGEIDDRYHDFSGLDSRFHRLINAAAPNRFIDGFYDLITLIFHYHYQWNKRDERQRNEVAIREHLTYVEALFSRNASIAELACRAHLDSARQTLIRATTEPPPKPIGLARAV
jgi:DNA-binding GntR family transcriptional regulator